MAYRIEISPTAMADVEGIFLWMKEYSVKQAHRWVRGCYEIMLTLTICTLVEDEYQKQLFRSDDLLISSIFPELKLTAKQIFNSSTSRNATLPVSRTTTTRSRRISHCPKITSQGAIVVSIALYKKIRS